MTLRFISISAVAWHAKSDASCINSPDLTTCSTKGSALLQRQTGDLGKTTVTDNGDPSSKDLETRLKAVETQQSEDHRSIKALDDRSSQSESEIKALDDRSSQSESEIKALDDRMEAAKGPQKLTKPKATQPEKGKTTDCSQMWWDSEHSLMTGPGTISGTPGSKSCEQTVCYDARNDGKCVVNSPCVMAAGNIGYVPCNARGKKSPGKKDTEEKKDDPKDDKKNAPAPRPPATWMRKAIKKKNDEKGEKKEERKLSKAERVKDCTTSCWDKKCQPMKKGKKQQDCFDGCEKMCDHLHTDYVKEKGDGKKDDKKGAEKKKDDAEKKQ